MWGPNVRLQGSRVAYVEGRREGRHTESLMEQLPNWLMAAIAAAGMTAYADELYPKVRTDQVVEDAPLPDTLPPAL
jgi:hypothetical protein